MKSLKNILSGSNSDLMLIFRKALFLVSFLLAFVAAQAQTVENSGSPQGKEGVKAKYLIKPNSRDEVVVMRDNKLKRIDKQRRQAAILKMQQMRNKRMMMMRNNQNRRQEIMQRRKLMMQKQRSLRK